MANKLLGYYYRVLAMKRDRQRKKVGPIEYASALPRYAGHAMLSTEAAHQQIYDKICSGEPFFAGRFGAFELLNMRSNDFGNFIGAKHGSETHFSYLCNNAGFFPQDISLLKQYADLMRDACQEVDFLAVWFHTFEDYYIAHHMKKSAALFSFRRFEPWSSALPWSRALAGKKVLVVHPFAKTIERQYAKRELLFPGTDILPEFELKTLKAVQTIAGETDDRFATWFDALDWMHQEAMKIDFDIAIIGCGAYGFPLAAKLKQSGKQAIHLAGVTQCLFGIKGARWDNDSNSIVRKLYTDAWVYPSEEDKPQNAKKVEGGCYW